MAKQHMPNPVAVWWLQIQGQCGWTGTGTSLHVRHHSSVHSVSQQIQRVEGPTIPWIILLYLNNLSFSHFPTCISAFTTASSTGDPAH